MATIKSFTSLEQSRKLAEILPLESADMHYYYDYNFNELESIPAITEEDDHFVLFPKDVRCWSLAALFGILQYPTLFQRADRKWGCTVWIDATMPYSVEDKDDPIDACVAMVEKLKELNLL